MGDENRTKLLTVAIASGAIVLIAIGAAIAIGTGSVLGWILAGFGAIDLVTGSFIARKLRAKGRGAADPAADPSHNPYARED